VPLPSCLWNGVLRFAGLPGRSALLLFYALRCALAFIKRAPLALRGGLRRKEGPFPSSFRGAEAPLFHLRAPRCYARAQFDSFALLSRSGQALHPTVLRASTAGNPALRRQE
jgi:hypothetical protein